MTWSTLFAEATEHHGCLTPDTAARHEIPARRLGGRARREGWPEPFPRVFVCPGAPQSPLQTVRAACSSTAGSDTSTRSSMRPLAGVPPGGPQLLETLRWQLR